MTLGWTSGGERMRHGVPSFLKSSAQSSHRMFYVTLRMKSPRSLRKQILFSPTGLNSSLLQRITALIPSTATALRATQLQSARRRVPTQPFVPTLELRRRMLRATPLAKREWDSTSSITGSNRPLARSLSNTTRRGQQRGRVLNQQSMIYHRYQCQCTRCSCKEMILAMKQSTILF